MNTELHLVAGRLIKVIKNYGDAEIVLKTNGEVITNVEVSRMSTPDKDK